MVFLGPVTRRALLAAAAILAPRRVPAVAEDPAVPEAVAFGSVVLQQGADAAGCAAAGAALYVTARPDSSTGIYAQAGKVPPLAACARRGLTSIVITLARARCSLTFRVCAAAGRASPRHLRSHIPSP